MTTIQNALSRIVEDAPDGIMVLDAEGMVLFANRASGQILRRSQEALVGMSFGHPKLFSRIELEIPLNNGARGTAEMLVAETRWENKLAYVAQVREVTPYKLLEQSLQQETDLLSAMAQSSPLALVALGRDGTIQLWSASAEHLFGWKATEVVGGFISPMLVADQCDEFDRLFHRVLAGDTVSNRETLCLTRTGEAIDVGIHASCLRTASGYIDGMLVLFEDIRERKNAQQKLLLSDKVFQNTQEGIVVTDGSGAIVSVNPAFTAVTGYLPEEALGKNPKFLKSGRHDAEFYGAMWEDIEAWGQWQGEIWNRRKDGEIYPEWMNISAIRNNSGVPVYYVAVFSDISLVKENEERLHRLAHYDVLTGLPNRTLIGDRLRQALVHARRNSSLVGLLFLDLDRFKLVNDTLGHRAGDLLLQGVAKRLSGVIRAQDTVGRLGGDEFTVILPEIASAGGAGNVALKIIEALAAPFHIEGHDLFATTSIGIAVYPNTGDTPDTLIKHADIAMYQAKAEGRNHYRYYHRGNDDQSRGVFEMENGLRHALERGEMRLVYQPEIEIESGRITVVEALLRWNHPLRGDIPPAEFIPVAEDTGLIGPIGEWVLRQACAQNKAWQDAGLPPVRVAVNLSVRQLRQVRFAEMVAQILDETGLDPDWLEVELTESMVMQYAKETLGILWQLKSMGVRLSVDDFGTGYSSLSYLKRLPVDTLKIDRSFVEGVVLDSNDQAISDAIIALARSLKLRVVAEGVESEDQLEFLRQHQCCDAQGFLFSRPVSGEDLAVLLKMEPRR